MLCHKGLRPPRGVPAWRLAIVRIAHKEVKAERPGSGHRARALKDAERVPSSEAAAPAAGRVASSAPLEDEHTADRQGLATWGV